ncbi:Chitinase 2 [Massospora cicadina]|nr:Chitinase 2 [Massospora cicadina]
MGDQNGRRIRIPPPHMINNIVNDINISPHFGGVMLWDASQNMHNTFDGYEFGKVVYSALNTSFLRNHPINLNPSYGKTAAAKSIPTHNQHTYGGTKSIYSSNQPTHHLSKPIPYNQVRVATKRIFDDQAHEVTNLTSPYQHTRVIANPHNQRTYGSSKPISYNQVDLAAKPIPHNQTHEVIKSISPYHRAYGILQPISPHKQQPHYQTKPIFSYDQVYEATKPLAHKVTMKPISKDYTQAATTKPPTAPYTVRPTHAITYPFNLIDPTQRKPIKVKYPDTASDPDPNPRCPVHGEPCNKLHACAGDQFATCDQGRWVLRPCGSNLVCGMAGDIVLCDLPNPRPN